ncbi:MAG: glycosyltransferase family 4 protein [Acidobacteria bacterium]|nr:glycosyltransferase family 4 protein [Acidobacteriota bacterium]
MSRAACAAITLAETGGGVAAAARLIWGAFESRWGSDATLVLLDPRAGGATPGLASRVSFGAKLMAAQARHATDWILYTHLSLAQVQDFVPGSMQRPYAVFLHGIELWRPLQRRQRAALEGARLLVANSAYTAGRASEMHPWLGPVAVSGLALPETASDAQLQTSREASAVPSVLIVGRMSSAERYKGHDQLIEAWPAVRRACPDARLVVVGDGDDRPRLQAKAAATTVSSGAIVFTGFVGAAELRELYRQAWIFAMPSRCEGFGLVYLEAMRHGLPCIGAIHDAAREVIDPDVTGVLVDQGDVSTLAAHVIRLLGDDALRASMGRAGRRRVQERFSRARFESRLMSLVDEAFGASAGTRSFVASDAPCRETTR